MVVIFRSPVSSNKLNIVSIRHIELSLLVILERRVIDTLLRHLVSTPHEHTLDLLALVCAEHAHLTEGPLTEVFPTLEETVDHVLSLVDFVTFLADAFRVDVHLVVHVPDRPAFFVEHPFFLEFFVSGAVEELVDGGTTLVFVVDIEGLEIEQVERSRREELKLRLRFLWLFIFIITKTRFLRGSSLCLLLLLLRSSSDLRLNTLLTRLHDTANTLEVVMRNNTLKPSRVARHSFTEASLKNSLLSNDEAASNN